MKEKKKSSDPLRPEKDVRIEDKDKGFLNTLKGVVGSEKKADDICPEHGLKGEWIPPSKQVDTTKLLVTYRCPEGHEFTIIRDTLNL